MDSKSQVHENDEQQPHHLDSQQVVTHGEEKEHHSVMSKVKAKARSIKDSIKKHYGKNEHQQHTPDHDHDLDIEEDKKMFQDPQVDHEAPIYESEVVKSAATPASSQQVESSDKPGGIDLEGKKYMEEEESHHDSLVDHGVSSPTEINQKIDTHPAKTFAEEERQEQYEVNLERPIVEEDPHEQGGRPGAYTLPNYQTKVTNPSRTGGDEIKDITAFEKSLERMNVHNEPKPTTELEIQSNVADNAYPHPTKTFDAEEKQEQSKGSLERPVDSEENPHELRSRPDAYTFPNYQTKVTNPSGAGSDEIKDFTAVEESFERMNVQDKPKSITESKIQSTVADNEYPHPTKQFAAEEKQEQRKVNFERPIDLADDPHEQGSRPDAYALPNYEPKVTNPSGAGSDEIKDFTTVEESFERMNVQDEPKPNTKSKIQSTVANIEYPQPTKPFATKEEQEQRKVNFERPIDLEEDPHKQGSRPDAYALPNYETKVTKPSGAGSDEINYSTTFEKSFERMNVQDEPKPTIEPEIQSTVADTEYPLAGSHVPHLSAATETQNEYPQETVSSNIINRNPKIGSSTGQTFNTSTTTVDKKPPYESGETQSKDKSYIDETEMPDATGDETLSTEIDKASKLGYDEKGERNDRVKTHADEQEKSGNGFNKFHSHTENLAPVYGGGSVETETKNVFKDHDDKGVSVKDNLAEKPSLGEKDKSLSELNSEALHEPKEEPKKKKNGGDEKSEKVPEEIHVNSPEKGMVDKVRGYVGSWFSTPDENQSPQVAGGEDLSKNKNSVAEVEQVSPVVDEPRKHE